MGDAWLLVDAGVCTVVLSLAVTQRLTMDVTPAPWLWMMPLAVYLLTLMIAFSKFCQPGALGGRLIGSRVSELLIALVLVASISSWVGFSWLVVPIHLSNWLWCQWYVTIIWHDPLRRPNGSASTT